MKLSIMILLMMLNACSPTKIEMQERCIVSLQFDYGTEEEIDSFMDSLDKYVSRTDLVKEFKDKFFGVFGKTRCHIYDPNEVKRLTKGEDYPLKKGDDIVGFKVDAWIKDITPWGRSLIKEKFNDRNN